MRITSILLLINCLATTPIESGNRASNQVLDKKFNSNTGSSGLEGTGDVRNSEGSAGSDDAATGLFGTGVSTDLNKTSSGLTGTGYNTKNSTDIAETEETSTGLYGTGSGSDQVSGDKEEDSNNNSNSRDGNRNSRSSQSSSQSSSRNPSSSADNSSNAIHHTYNPTLNLLTIAYVIIHMF